jgi:hypothetical protein
MKRTTLPALLLLFLLFPAQLSAQPDAESAPIFRKHLSVKLFGGMARWSMGDWNDYYGYLKTWEGRLRGGEGAVFYGEDFHYGRDGEIEVQYSFHPQYKVGIGIGRAWGGVEFGWEQDGSSSFQQYRSINQDFRDESIDANITPILLTFYTNSPTYPNQPYLGLGVGYYFSSFEHYQDRDYYTRLDSLNVDEYKTIFENDIEYIDDNKMSARGIGFHAVVGTEYFITPNISFVGELKGRYVKISGYSGTQKRVAPDTSWTRDVKCIVTTQMDENGEFRVSYHF